MAVVQLRVTNNFGNVLVRSGGVPVWKRELLRSACVVLRVLCFGKQVG